jgi:hypothetical protein
MEIGDTKSFKKAVIAFFIVACMLQLVDFGSFYLGRYGFSLPPPVHGQESLWWLFYHDAKNSIGGGMVTATMVYLAARRKRVESKPDVAL